MYVTRGEVVARLVSIPPVMPWHLVPRGTTLLTLHWMPIRRARERVPDRFTVVRFRPGYTIGALLLADYGPGSDLEYNEIIVSCATVFYAGRLGAWVTHLFVDNPDSVVGGRELLGAPKCLVPFGRETGVRSRISVGDTDRPICRMEFGRQLWLWRQRLWAPALHLDVRDTSGGTVSAHGNEVRGRVGLTRARVEIPEGSPLHALGFGRPFLSLCGREMEVVMGGASFLRLRSIPIPPQACR